MAPTRARPYGAVAAKTVPQARQLPESKLDSPWYVTVSTCVAVRSRAEPLADCRTPAPLPTKNTTLALVATSVWTVPGSPAPPNPVEYSVVLATWPVDSKNAVPSRNCVAPDFMQRSMKVMSPIVNAGTASMTPLAPLLTEASNAVAD